MVGLALPLSGRDINVLLAIFIASSLEISYSNPSITAIIVPVRPLPPWQCINIRLPIPISFIKAVAKFITILSAVILRSLIGQLYHQ